MTNGAIIFQGNFNVPLYLLPFDRMFGLTQQRVDSETRAIERIWASHRSPFQPWLTAETKSALADRKVELICQKTSKWSAVLRWFTGETLDSLESRIALINAILLRDAFSSSPSTGESHSAPSIRQESVPSSRPESLPISQEEITAFNQCWWDNADQPPNVGDFQSNTFFLFGVQQKEGNLSPYVFFIQEEKVIPASISHVANRRDAVKNLMNFSKFLTEKRDLIDSSNLNIDFSKFNTDDLIKRCDQKESDFAKSIFKNIFYSNYLQFDGLLDDLNADKIESLEDITENSIRVFLEQNVQRLLATKITTISDGLKEFEHKIVFNEKENHFEVKYKDKTYIIKNEYIYSNLEKVKKNIQSDIEKESQRTLAIQKAKEMGFNLEINSIVPSNKLEVKVSFKNVSLIKQIDLCQLSKPETLLNEIKNQIICRYFEDLKIEGVNFKVNEKTKQFEINYKSKAVIIDFSFGTSDGLEVQLKTKMGEIDKQIKEELKLNLKNIKTKADILKFFKNEKVAEFEKEIEGEVVSGKLKNSDIPLFIGNKIKEKKTSVRETVDECLKKINFDNSVVSIENHVVSLFGGGCIIPYHFDKTEIEAAISHYNENSIEVILSKSGFLNFTALTEDIVIDQRKERMVDFFVPSGTTPVSDYKKKNIELPCAKLSCFYKKDGENVCLYAPCSDDDNKNFFYKEFKFNKELFKKSGKKEIENIIHEIKTLVDEELNSLTENLKEIEKKYAIPLLKLSDFPQCCYIRDVFYRGCLYLPPTLNNDMLILGCYLFPEKNLDNSNQSLGGIQCAFSVRIEASQENKNGKKIMTMGHALLEKQITEVSHLFSDLTGIPIEEIKVKLKYNSNNNYDQIKYNKFSITIENNGRTDDREFEDIDFILAPSKDCKWIRSLNQTYGKRVLEKQEELFQERMALESLIDGKSL